MPKRNGYTAGRGEDMRRDGIRIPIGETILMPKLPLLRRYFFAFR